MKRDARVAELVTEAVEADKAIDAGGEVYAASDVHAWLQRLARGQAAVRPKPARR